MPDKPGLETCLRHAEDESSVCGVGRQILILVFVLPKESLKDVDDLLVDFGVIMLLGRENNVQSEDNRSECKLRCPNVTSARIKRLGTRMLLGRAFSCILSVVVWVEEVVVVAVAARACIFSSLSIPSASSNGSRKGLLPLPVILPISSPAERRFPIASSTCR